MASVDAQVETLQGPGLMRFLSGLLANVNAYAQSYKMMYEVEQTETAMAAYDNRAPAKIRMAFEASSLRGSFARATEEQFRNISDIDKICDPLTYPLLFPTGDGGCELGLRNREGTRITQKEYYAYLFPIHNYFNPILHAGALCQQFAVDAYVKIEQNRLNFQRRNQLILRRDTSRGLQDYLAEADSSGPPGNRVVLSSSHPGSPRAMQQAYQVAMVIVARYGRPTLFSTTTCNSNWKELRGNLYCGQSSSDRPDLVARVFNAKLQEYCTDLCKKNILGGVEAYVFVVEFQKCGLPHCHMLLIMKENCGVRTAEDVDESVCAEIPNREAEPELYAAVTAYMIHRQCGVMDPRSPCMQNGSCLKLFPKKDTRQDDS
uniref:Helitron_like_N domain-containing protein n=1 Tax=Haemonchus contortus TaxID=6289 RepID=A0A7I4Z2G5_HAECO